MMPRPTTPPAPPPFDIVVIVASAGGIQALTRLVGALPVSLAAGVVVVQHLDQHAPSVLPAILARSTLLPTEVARTGHQVRPGHLYVAPAGRHVAINAAGMITLTDAPPVRYVRPSGDVLFHATARAFGARAIAVVLTGTGRDGADGVVAVKSAGGIVLVQDPATAEFTGMPAAAIATGCVDSVASIESIVRQIIGLTHTEVA